MEDYDYLSEGQTFYDGDTLDYGEESEKDYANGENDGSDDGEFSEGTRGGYDGDLNFEMDFQQQQTFTYEKEIGTGYIEGVSKKMQRMQRSPEDLAINQLGYYMSEMLSLTKDDTKRAKIEDIARKTPNLALLHLQTFALAALWIAEKNEMDSKTFKKFYAKYGSAMDESVSEVDIFRYIRLLS